MHILGVVLRLLELHFGAIEYYNWALAIDKNVRGLHYNLGLVLYVVHEIAKAAQHCKRATALKPDFSDVHDPLNKFLWQRGKAEEYLESYAAVMAVVRQAAYVSHD